MPKDKEIPNAPLVHQMVGLEDGIVTFDEEDSMTVQEKPELVETFENGDYGHFTELPIKQKERVNYGTPKDREGEYNIYTINPAPILSPSGDPLKTEGETFSADVVSVCDGNVIVVTYDDPYLGNTIFIKSSDGRRVYSYSNLSEKPTKPIDAYVSAGDIIGKVTTSLKFQVFKPKEEEKTEEKSDLTKNDVVRIIKRYCREYGCPIPFALATAQKESGLNPNVKTNPAASHRHYKEIKNSPGLKGKFDKCPDKNNPEVWGAYGIFQLLPGFQWDYFDSAKGNVTLKEDVDLNCKIGVKKLSGAWSRWGNVADIRWRYAGFAAAGPDFAAAVDGYKKDVALAIRYINHALPKIIQYTKEFAAKHNEPIPKLFPNKMLENEYNMLKGSKPTPKKKKKV